MNRNEVMVKFSDLSDQAEQLNSKTKTRRFYPMTNTRAGKVIEFGMYDGKTKRYVLCETNSQNAVERLNEIETMLKNA